MDKKVLKRDIGKSSNNLNKHKQYTDKPVLRGHLWYKDKVTL